MRARPILLTLAMAFATAGCGGSKQPNDDAVLEMQTRQLLNGFAIGDQHPWSKLLDANAVYVSEDNEVLSGKDVLGVVRPVPKGVRGTITPEGFRVRDFGDVAVATYIADERANYFGQEADAKYRVMDTWHRTRDGWRLLASEIYAVPRDPPASTLPPEVLRQYVGTYRLPSGRTYTITFDGNQLKGARAGGRPELLVPELKDIFFVPGSPRSRKIFKRDQAGRIAAIADRREGVDLVWPRIK
jgi:Domain of unknown function (DUF4440)